MSKPSHRRWTLLMLAGVLVAVAMVVVLDPIAAAVSVVPWPPLPELPELPGWVKWVWRGAIVALIALGIVGTLDKNEGSDHDEPEVRPGDPPRAR